MRRAVLASPARAAEVIPGSGGPQVAIVTGATGQDGYFLSKRLLGDGWIVHAVVRPRSSVAELLDLRPRGQLVIQEIDLRDEAAMTSLVATLQPEEFYNLAGLSSVSASFTEPTAYWQTNADAVLALLEAVRCHSPKTRFYQASSSEMFGSLPGQTVIHNEQSPLVPQSPYAAAKAAAHHLCNVYRGSYGLRIACGILYNHESSRRPRSFLSRKVVDHVAGLRGLSAARLRHASPLVMGNLRAQRDWGYAPDYVDGIVRIARQVRVRASHSRQPDQPDVGTSYRDYVLGTGRLHAVWQLVDRAFNLAGLDLEWDMSTPNVSNWSARFRRTGSLAVRVDPDLMRPSDPTAIQADASRARLELGWSPRPGLDPFLTDMLENRTIP